MGRVIQHEAVTYAVCPDAACRPVEPSLIISYWQDGRTGWRYTVAFISSRVFTFDEDELGRPEDVVDRRLSGH